MRKAIPSGLLLFLISVSGVLAETPPDTAWVRKFDRTGCSSAIGYACAIDSIRNIIYTTGATTCLASKADVFILGLNSTDGQWYDSLAYDDSLHLIDRAHSSALDIDSNYIYTAGSSVMEDTCWLFLKHDLDNDSLLWARRYKLGEGGDNFAWRSILSKDKRFLYSSGFTNGEPMDAILFKIDALTGDSLWIKRYACVYDSSDHYFGLAISPDDSIAYVCGSTNNGSHSVGLIHAYKAGNGDSLWAVKYDFGKSLEFNDCALDIERNFLYVSGVEGVSGKVMAVDLTNGDTLWTRTYTDPDTMLYLSCHLDASGNNLYVAGNEQFNHDSSRCWAAKYDVITGDTVWSKRITTDNACNIWVFCCEVDQNNDLFLSGWATDSLNHMAIIKLKTGPTGVKGNPIDNSKISKPRLGNSFPNPFYSKISINYQLASSGYFKLAVYNVTGQMVRLLDEGFRKAGSYNINWDGRNQKGVMAVNGAYLLQLYAGDQSAVGKILLVK